MGLAPCFTASMRELFKQRLSFSTLLVVLVPSQTCRCRNNLFLLPSPSNSEAETCIFASLRNLKGKVRRDGARSGRMKCDGPLRTGYSGRTSLPSAERDCHHGLSFEEFMICNLQS